MLVKGLVSDHQLGEQALHPPMGCLFPSRFAERSWICTKGSELQGSVAHYSAPRPQAFSSHCASVVSSTSEACPRCWGTFNWGSSRWWEGVGIL